MWPGRLDINIRKNLRIFRLFRAVEARFDSFLTLKKAREPIHNNGVSRVLIFDKKRDSMNFTFFNVILLTVGLVSSMLLIASAAPDVMASEKSCCFQNAGDIHCACAAEAMSNMDDTSPTVRMMFP